MPRVSFEPPPVNSLSLVVLVRSTTQVCASALPAAGCPGYASAFPQSSPGAASLTALPSSSNTASSSTPPPGLLANEVVADVAHQMSTANNIEHRFQRPFRKLITFLLLRRNGAGFVLPMGNSRF